MLVETKKELIPRRHGLEDMRGFARRLESGLPFSRKGYVITHGETSVNAFAEPYLFCDGAVRSKSIVFTGESVQITYRKDWGGRPVPHGKTLADEFRDWELLLRGGRIGAVYEELQIRLKWLDSDKARSAVAGMAFNGLAQDILSNPGTYSFSNWIRIRFMRN